MAFPPWNGWYFKGHGCLVKNDEMNSQRNSRTDKVHRDQNRPNSDYSQVQFAFLTSNKETSIQ
jgi:hypothetical protein